MSNLSSPPIIRSVSANTRSVNRLGSKQVRSSSVAALQLVEIVIDQHSAREGAAWVKFAMP